MSLGAWSHYAGNTVLAQEQTSAMWCWKGRNAGSGENVILSKGFVVTGASQRFLEVQVTLIPSLLGAKPSCAPPRGRWMMMLTLPLIFPGQNAVAFLSMGQALVWVGAEPPPRVSADAWWCPGRPGSDWTPSQARSLLEPRPSSAVGWAGCSVGRRLHGWSRVLPNC